MLRREHNICWSGLFLSLVLGLSCLPACSRSSRAELPTFEEAVETAINLLTTSQQEDGNWVPELTPHPMYEEAVAEPEVTATGMMLSVLRPIAESYCLQPQVNSAFEFVSSQIEPSGLVRFYGRHDHLSPENQNVSIAPDRWMSPDLGDTALAWLVATPSHGRERVYQMLDHIEEHRDEQHGMYLTWLGDPDSYFMRHRARNPIDIQILFEVYLVMQSQRVEMEAAGRICDFLQHHVNEKDYWVWFRYAPLAPLLTLYDMELAGCPLEVDPDLLEPSAEHQADYYWLAETFLQLNRVEFSTPPPAAELRAIERRLRVMARNDFESMQMYPAMIYNKEIEEPRGFYWMTEFGLALWLRVAEKLQRFSPTGAQRPWCPGIGGYTSEVELR